MPRKRKRLTHVEKRVINDNRSKLTPEQILEIVNSDNRYQVGQKVFFWSFPDGKTMEATVARQRKKIVTIHDTSRRNETPLLDMITKSRAGLDPFKTAQAPQNFDELNSGVVSITRIRPDKMTYTDIVQLGTWFDFTKDNQHPLETRELHEMIATGCEKTWIDDIPRSYRNIYARIWLGPTFSWYFPVTLSIELTTGRRLLR